MPLLISQFLVETQNADGGWGYFPGASSWMEPTFYAALALQGTPEGQDQADRAFALVRSWQLPGGGCRPGPAVDQANWTTALWVTLHCVRGVFDDPFRAGLNWLLGTKGAEGALWRRVLQKFKPKEVGYEPGHYGWPWFPDTNSWVEPTVHALVAMKSTLAAGPEAAGEERGRLRDRIRKAEQMLLDRRCADGGWNYGARAALGVDLPSYPEATGVALVGLQGVRDAAIRESLGKARAMWEATDSPLAKAWLRLALRVHGVAGVPDESSEPPGGDVMVAALQQLGESAGTCAPLCTGTAA